MVTFCHVVYKFFLTEAEESYCFWVSELILTEPTFGREDRVRDPVPVRVNDALEKKEVGKEDIGH
jgi:hypothetical protein